MRVKERATLMKRLGSCLLLVSSSAWAGTLYDPALATLPSDQGWAFLPNPPFGNGAVAELDAGLFLLDTTAEGGDQAGYFGRVPPDHVHPELGVLDRFEGYAVSLEVQVLEESHVRPDRAGFSLIVISSDLLGVELAFWQDEVWAQDDDPLFIHGEGAALDTTAALTRHDLHVTGDSYSLFVGPTLVLSGPLKDYSSFGAPYDTPDFIFFGDDTSSAAARVAIGRIELCTAEDVVPIGETLRLRKEGSDVVLEQRSGAPATEYRVYRDATAEQAGTLLTLVTPSLPARDMLAVDDGRSGYYVLRSADACGRESD